MNYIFAKVHLKYRFKKSEKLSNPGATSYLINWGMDIVKKRYDC